MEAADIQPEAWCIFIAPNVIPPFSWISGSVYHIPPVASTNLWRNFWLRGGFSPKKRLRIAETLGRRRGRRGSMARDRAEDAGGLTAASIPARRFSDLPAAGRNLPLFGGYGKTAGLFLTKPTNHFQFFSAGNDD